MKLYIKNMVCNRCILVVKQEAEKLGLTPQKVILGELELEEEQLTEQQVHDLTAVTGSAPAFLYSFVEALEKSALSFGITKEQARKLVLEMVIGSAAMLEKHRDPAQLREQVTSPGGATAAGLSILAENHFDDVIHRAIEATNKRAKQQGQE
jgi:pyrroline-5-carboxylate reductase